MLSPWALPSPSLNSVGAEFGIYQQCLYPFSFKSQYNIWPRGTYQAFFCGWYYYRQQHDPGQRDRSPNLFPPRTHGGVWRVAVAGWLRCLPQPPRPVPQLRRACLRGAAPIAARPSPPAQPPRPRASVFRQGTPDVQARTLKGNRTHRSQEGGKGHLSFLCGISKEEAPRRPGDKGRQRVNGEPRV